MGSMAANLGQSAMPIQLNGDNVDMERVSEKIAIASKAAASGDEPFPIDFSLTLNLPMKRTTVLKKAKLLSCDTFGLQLEYRAGLKKEQKNLIAAVLPLLLVTAASSQELDGYADPGHEAGVDMDYNDPVHVSMARGSHNGAGGGASAQPAVNKTNEFRPLYSETDLRDSFARVMLMAFVRICIDVAHFVLAVTVLCLAPWRFFALVYSLCEPKRRFPVRVAGKLMNPAAPLV